jgi:hypothetical protein
LTPANSDNFAGAIRGGSFADTTADSNYDDDLDAIILVDPVFYGVSIMGIGATNIQKTAAWCSSNDRIFAYDSADTANLTANSGIGDTLKDLGYTYSFGMFSYSPGEFGALGLMAQRFTAVPGTDTWAFKTIVGLEPDDILTPTQLDNLLTNNMNYYTTIAGLHVVTDGRSAEGQYMDIQRGIDALKNDIQVRVFGLLANSEKVPYTTAGISMVGAELRASLKSFTATPSQPNLFLSSDPGFEPVVTLPDIADISTADKQDRVLTNVNFTATTTGAIQNITIAGTLSF